MYGFEILPRGPDPDPGLIARAAKLPVSNISDCMSRSSGSDWRIRPMHAGGGFAGCALTVKTRPGDNLMLHKALDIGRPGDVIMVDAGGDLSNALLGELMAAYADSRGLAGIVIDGAVRDSTSLKMRNFPVYAAGITHRGPYKDGPGVIGCPVSIGGMTVMPGDIIVGDDDGVLAIPAGCAAMILTRAEAVYRSEAEQSADIQAGTWRRDWVDTALETSGVPLVVA